MLYGTHTTQQKNLIWRAWEHVIVESEVAQSCPTLCDPMDCSLPSSSVHGTFQAIVLEWVAISFSRGSSQPRDRIQVSCIVDRCFTAWATREVCTYSIWMQFWCLRFENRVTPTFPLLFATDNVCRWCGPQAAGGHSGEPTRTPLPQGGSLPSRPPPSQRLCSYTSRHFV